MINLRIAAVILAAAVSSGCFGQKWTRGDYALQASFIVLTAVDMHQTSIVTERCLEMNPIIGRCGNGPVPIALWFPVVAIANALVADALPGRWRTAFQAFTVGFQTSVAVTNWRNGVYSPAPR